MSDLDPMFGDPAPGGAGGEGERDAASASASASSAASAGVTSARAEEEAKKEHGERPEPPHPGGRETSASAPVPSVPSARAEVVPEPPPRKSGWVAPLSVAVGLLLLAGVAALLAYKVLWLGPDSPPINTAALSEQREQAYLEGGWESEAREVLRRFLEARSINGKAAYSIRGSELLPEMEAFYASRVIDDSDTPAHAFSVYPLSLEDRTRGIFMLTYERPPMLDMSELFAPIAPMEVEYQLEAPSLLLSTAADSSNFLAEPLKVYAIFKRGPEGLRVDWETFVQTKYRTLRRFLDVPEPGKSGVFRVTIQETVPGNRRVPAGHRTYLVADPAHHREDLARIDVAVDSEIGRALSLLNWRSTGNARVDPRTATLELAWTREDVPKLETSRFICWEFLGVGGEALPESE